MYCDEHIHEACATNHYVTDVCVSVGQFVVLKPKNAFLTSRGVEDHKRCVAFGLIFQTQNVSECNVVQSLDSVFAMKQCACFYGCINVPK